MKKIFNELKKKKFIPLDKFINIALYDKKEGYYIKKNPFGKKGDFITSPFVSNLFGEIIAIWCIAYWEYLEKPKKILFVELGPGDGTLCKILTRSFKRFSEFYNNVEINLLEISGRFKQLQKKNIANKKVKWIKNIEEINYGPIIFFGNEFFDSLAIKQFQRKNDVFFEKHVSRLKNKKNLKFIFKKANKNSVKKLINLNLVTSQSTIEYPVDTIKYLKKIANKINQFNGCMLTFDYGYTSKNNGDTLRSIKKHKYSDPLVSVGGSDISSHLNFTLLSEILKNNNLNVTKVITQSEFLQKMGIVERANIISRNISFKEKAEIFYRLKKLLDLKEMGGTFKVLFAQKKDGNFSLGF